MALKRRGPEIGLLHHSDQGGPYASEDYQAILDARGIVCSNEEGVDPMQTAQSAVSHRLHTHHLFQ
jgi:hypothetical protein